MSRNTIPIQMGLWYPPRVVTTNNGLGCGYKLNDKDPIKGKVFQMSNDQAIIDQASVYGRSNLFLMDTQKSAFDSMDIEGHLSVSYNLMNGDAGGTYLKESMSSSRTTVVWYKSRKYHTTAEVGDSASFSPDINNLIKNNDLGSIPKEYGTKYIQQIHFGAELDIKLVFVASTSKELSDFKGEISGGAGAGPVSIDVLKAGYKNRTEKDSKNLRLIVDAKASGVSTPDFLSKKDPLDQLDFCIKKFNEDFELLLKEAEKDRRNTKKMTAIAYSLSDIRKHMPILSEEQEEMLELRMKRLSIPFKTASYWTQKLLKAQEEQEIEYTKDPSDRERIFEPYKKAVQKQIGVLDEKLQECQEFRLLPLAELIGMENLTKPVPEEYPSTTDANLLHGLVGSAFLPAPVSLPGSQGNKLVKYDYKGFTIEDDVGSLKPWMRGILLDCLNGEEVAHERTPRQLLKKMPKYQIDLSHLAKGKDQDWQLDPHDYNPAVGELSLPADAPSFDKLRENGHKFSFDDKILALLGNKGSGKNTLFKRLTGNHRTSARETTYAMVGEQRIANTPDLDGTKNNVHQNVQMLNALTSGEVSQICFVAKFERKTGSLDALPSKAHVFSWF